MYTSKNFKTKKELRAAVAAWNEQQDFFRSAGIMNQSNVLNRVEPVTIFAPGLGRPKTNGWETVEGPHFPQPHRWYAQVEMKDGIVVKVK